MKLEHIEPKGSFFMPNENVQLGHGDCLELLKSIPDGSVDSIVTDPPAGIGFMNKDWDSNKGGRDNWIAWMQSVMIECMRVLKSGGHALIWAIPRTSHWTATAAENSGFEIRDVVHHVFGSGFPKSHDVSKAIDKMMGVGREIVSTKIRKSGDMRSGNFKSDSRQDSIEHTTIPSSDAAKQWNGWGTALKPAVEHWILARKPFKGTVAQNVLEHGCGALNIDGCRVGDESHSYTPRLTKNTNLNDDGWSKIGNDIEQVTISGRFPANLIHDGSDEVLDCFPENQSRFFYCAKASKKDRDEGLDGFDEKNPYDRNSVTKAYEGLGRKSGARRNHHPTVKPHELMKYLCRLITPPNGTILDPFMGSGSTGKAAIVEGFGFIGIEQNVEYFEIAKARIENAKPTG